MNRKSNHPRAVIESVVNSMSHRISKLSANEEIFRNNADYYNQALKREGYNETIEYMSDEKHTGENRGKSTASEQDKRNEHVKGKEN